ncbi:cellobiose 2-epimerase [Clostridia bacterium]|nr:cellobiose 2-epimerase [Clostridia bacterium]
MLRTNLNNKILPFWKGLIDRKRGGFYGYVDFDLNVDKDAVKGCILNSRILWFFANAGEREYADHAYRFLTERCIDRENLGVYWSVSADGTPFDTTKHCYNQAFAIYALSAYYELSGDADALKLAYELFEVIEQKCADPNGYGEAYDLNWNKAGNEKLSENGVEAARTMNTLLHVFEAYSGLYKADKKPEVAAKMRKILDIFKTKVFNPALDRQEVFFDADYNSLLDLQSYGHDIEASWLIDWGTDLLQDAALSKEIGDLTTRLAVNVYNKAYHKQSLWNECERGIENKTRIWWVQAEAALGFFNLYEKTRDDKYLTATRELLGYIEDKLTDKRDGSEWFWDLDDNDRPTSRNPIAEPWKCPYHNGRMVFELLRRKFE